MCVGAFALYTGSSLDASAKASLAKTDIEAGGELRRSHEVLRTDGDLEACRDAVNGAASPPEQCGALLRVELTPIDRRGNSTTASSASNDQQRAELESAAHRWQAAQQGTRIALRRRARLLSVQPVLTPSFGGVSLTGRF